MNPRTEQSYRIITMINEVQLYPVMWAAITSTTVIICIARLLWNKYQRKNEHVQNQRDNAIEQRV